MAAVSDICENYDQHNPTLWSEDLGCRVAIARYTIYVYIFATYCGLSLPYELNELKGIWSHI